MAMSPAVQERCTNAVVERKLDELCASLRSALSPPLPRSPDAERRLVAEIKYKIDFIRSFLTAERDCRSGARPAAYLVEAEERFAVLKATFDEWARRVVPPLHATEEEEGKVMEAQDDDDGSGSDCSCTDSCQELTATDRVTFEASMDVTSAATDKKCGREQDSVVRCEEVSPDTVAKKRDTEGAAVVPREEEAASDASPEKRDRERDSVVTREEVTPEAVVAKKHDTTEGADVVPREEAKSDATAKKRDAEHRTKVNTDSSTDQRRWWRRSAAWCGAAGVLAVVAVGLAVELAAVDHHNVDVYVVPT